MNYNYDNVVVGSSFDAVLFAFVNNYPIVYSGYDFPFRFDYIDQDVDLSSVKIENITSVVKTIDDQVLVGIPKVILWERMLFLLSLDSKAPLSNLCHSLRRKDKKIICSNEYSKIAEINFNTCHFFYDSGASNFVKEKELASDKYICYDWIAINKGGKQKIDLIETNDMLAKEMWFYPSDRIDGATAIKDVCVVSVLTKQQINDFNYSETMVRFKLLHEMQSLGLKGPSNGYGPNGKLKHYKIRATSTDRTIRKLQHSLKPNTCDIKITQLHRESFLSRIPKACMAYDRFLRHL